MNQKTGATAIAVAGTFAAVSQHTASTASFLALVLTALYYINGKLPKNP